MKRKFITLAEELAGKEAPSELRLFRKGVNKTTKGPFLFDDKAAKAVMKAFEEYGNDLCFDYAHAVVPEVGAAPKEQVAAGWFGLEVRDGELWAVNIRWTDDAKSAIEKKEWRYCSPYFAYDEKSTRILEIFNVALTNTPATHDAMPLVAADRRTDSLAGFRATQRALEEALRKRYLTKDEYSVWVTEVYDAEVVFAYDNKLWRQSYELKGLTATLVGDAVQVEITYTPVQATSRDACPQHVALDRREAILGSFQDIISSLSDALTKRYPQAGGWNLYPDAVFDDVVVFRRDGKLWQMAYHLDGATAVLDGEPTEVEVSYVPVAPAGSSAASAVPYKSGPVDSSSGWSGKAAEKSVRDWSSNDKGELDYGKYSRAFAWFDSKKAEALGSYKLIHHEVQNGELVVSRAGVIAAAAACQGARGGVDIPDSDMDDVKSHLGKHYAAMKMTPPWEAKDQKTSRSPSASDPADGVKVGERSIMDKAFLSALGLAENAPETEALAKLTRITANISELCKLTGKDPKEPNAVEAALGVAAGWKAHAEQLPAAQKQVAELQAAARKAEVSAVLDSAPTKVTPAMKPSLLAARPFDKDEDVAWLKAHVEALPTISALDPGNKPNQPQSPTAQTPAAGGKKYEELSMMEKHNLYVSDRVAFDALKADHIARNGK